VQDKAWQAQVQSVVRSMVQPLVADGGSFSIESCDPATREIVIRASMSKCDGCAMSEEDLARLIEEAVKRNDPRAKVSVVSGT
jgi:Fe-S cluster biogenesis protein NfuA